MTGRGHWKGTAILVQNPTRGRLARPQWFLKPKKCGFNFHRKQCSCILFRFKNQIWISLPIRETHTQSHAEHTQQQGAGPSRTSHRRTILRAPGLQAEECAKAALRPSGPDLEPGNRSARARESHRLAFIPALPSPSPSRDSAQGCGFSCCIKPSCPPGRTAKLSSCLFKLPALVGKRRRRQTPTAACASARCLPASDAGQFRLPF